MRRAYSVAAYVVAFVMMAMFVSCTEDSEVDAYTPTDVPSASGMIDITLNVAMASEEDEELTTSTRVGVGETTSSGGWTFVWEEGDELTAATATGDTPTYTQLTMSYFNLFASSFSGTVESGTDLRLLYPKFESSTIDLSSQDGKISCYLISDGYVNATTAEPFTPTMKQLGSYMVVNLNLTGDNLTKYAIERLEFCDVPTAATISLTKAYDSANLLTDIVYGDIVADMSSGENRAITINDDGTGTARVYLNILPFTKAQGERITIKCTFVDTTTDKKYYAEKMIEAKNSDATFNRATLYTTTLNYDVASTFNELWALAEFSADDYPTSKTWYVSDATATEEDFAGLKEALEKANTNKDINVVMLNLESVPGSAFEPCLYLTSIELPTAMTIGDYAFADCPSLSSIELPAATTFGEWAFNYCESLTSIDLPAATSIGNVTFHQCTSLTSINLPEVKTIGEYAFRNASSLSSIELPVATTIGEGAFTRCESLTSIYLPAATSIENLAFDDCESLTSIDLPVATSIGEGAFVYCSSLTDISLGYEGDGVSSIGTDAFVTVTTSNIDLTIKVAEDSSITIVGTTLYTGNNTYTFKSINGDELWALADFTADSYPENKTWYVSDTTATISDDVDDFAGLKAALEKANGDKDINVVMLNLESVPGDAFRSCKSLTSIELPAATTIGVNAFKYCSALTSIELPVATTIGESAFYYCSALSSIELPVATTIGDYAFMGCTSITNISLGDEDGVLSIGTDAFWDVTTENIDLTIKVAEDSSITISGTTLNTDSESITFNSINGNELWALEDFSATSYPESKTWYVSDATAETDDFVGLDAALENANGDKDINVVMLNLESVPEKAFYRCSDLTSIELPVATTIGYYAFYNCTALSSIELPVATTIRERAFYYCKALTSISLGDEGNGVSSILTSVFLYVTTENIDLTIKVAEDSDITISGTILNTGYNTYTFKSINGYEEWALANFTAESYPESKTWYVSNTTAETDDFAGLKAALATANTNKDINVVMLNLESLPNGAFNECTSLSSIELPAAKAIGYYAFYGCTSLTSIELPEVTTLREFTFESCSALTSIELPKATTIETSAFYSCTALSSISLGDEGDGVSSIWGDAFSGVTTSNIYLTIKVAGSTISISGTTLNTGYNTYTFNSITVAE